MPELSRHLVVGGFLFAGLLTHACAQIFTCVDGKGRRLTADRPIAECTDREQQELGPTGIVKRRIGPQLTADERAIEEEKARQALEERNRLAEEKKRDRALLTRYPNRAVHDKERNAALALADAAIISAKKRTAELHAERKRLEVELEFFTKDPSRIPQQLTRQGEAIAQGLEAQARFIANQARDRQQINARFDEELLKLRALWAQRAAPVGAVRPAAAKR